MKEKTIYALGFFDGVHLGHQALLRSCRELAQKAGCLAGVVTFSTHPDTLVSGQTPALINTEKDREQLLFSYGMDKVVSLPFDKALMTTHWSDFLGQLIAGDGAGFVCGSDFRFGAGGSGTAKELEGFCKAKEIPYCVVPQQLLDGVRVSSTHIRCLLEEGKIEETNRFLGHPYILTGTVVTGRGLGKTWGIPTANIQLPEELIRPKLGVYAGMVGVEDKSYKAVINIGNRPTVGGHHVTVEAWLLDFEGDLYGKTVTVSLLHFLRPEKKFPNVEDLQKEIQKNAGKARKMLENT